MKGLKNFLRTKLIENQFIYLDLWSAVHFFVGYALFAYLNLNPATAITILILFEIAEPYIKTFRKEHGTDTIWDVIVGIAGYYIARGLA